MPKIHTIEIKNFRGIENFKYTFGITNFVCLIGRGDSGKTTLLDAISFVLHPNWNLTFYDTDFYNCDISTPIEIEATLYDLPTKLLQEDKYGLYIRGVKSGKNEIVDDVDDDHESALTIKLTVDKELEPKWHIINERQEPIEIKSNDRASLNVFLISNYIDRHFTWNKGTPLYSLLREIQTDRTEKNILTDALRSAKETIDKSTFEHLDGVVGNIKTTAKSLGTDISNSSSTIDFKDIYIKDGRICLHDNQVPFRLKGKGSKRLISMAIQLELAKSGGILLIDEIEQGLEPDRVQHLVRTLNHENQGQIFVTTHSRDVLVELAAKNLYLMRQNANVLVAFDDSFQGCLRKTPEAFFAKKIILCEGATEVGICRALNSFRVEKGEDSNSVLGIRIVDGTGSNFVNYCKSFINAGFKVCIVCDSDDPGINSKKEELIAMGAKIVDCENGNSIEKQVISDLPWYGVRELMDYRIGQYDEISVKDAVSHSFGSPLQVGWEAQDSIDLRMAISQAAINKEWFKRIDHGTKLGEICMKYINDMTGKPLKNEFDNLMKWIDND